MGIIVTENRIRLTTSSLMLPAQSGHSGQYLRTSGSTLSWAAVDLSNEVSSTRQIIAGNNLTGGGNLSADRTIDVVPDPSFGTVTATTVVADGASMAGHSFGPTLVTFGAGTTIQVGNGVPLYYDGGNLHISGTLEANAFSGDGSAIRNATPVVFASRVYGVVLDADPDTNTGTDNTAALQAILDGGNVHLVIDGPCLVDTLYIEGNTIIEGSANGLLFKLGSPNSGRPVIRNKNPVTGPTAPTDENIVLRNLYVDGNRRGGGSGSTGTNPDLTDPIYRAIANDSGYVVPSIGFFGVDGIHISNVHVFDSPAYGIQLSNVVHVRVFNYSKTRVEGDPILGDDVFHLNGWCKDVKAYGIYGTCLDDALALNGNDGNDFDSPVLTFEPGTVAAGPIEDVSIVGAYFSHCVDVCRILTADTSAYIRNVLLSNVGGVSFGGGGYGGFYCDTFNVPGDGSYGLIDGLTLRDCYVSGTYGAGVRLLRTKLSNVGLTIENLVCDAGGPALEITTDCRSGRVKVNGITSGAVPAVVIASNATYPVDVDLGGLGVDSVTYTNSAAVTVAGDGGRVAVRNGRVAGVANVMSLTGSAHRDIVCGGLSHLAAKGGYSITSDTAVSRVATYGLDCDLLANLPAGSKVKHDGAGWHSTLFVRDLFAGSAAANLGGHVSTNGVTWLADTLGAGQQKLSGDGWMYLGGSDTVNFLPDGNQPATGDFEVEFDLIRRTAHSGAFNVTLLSASNLSGFVGLTIEDNVISWRDNFVLFAGTVAGPAVGTVWRIRLGIASASTTRTLTSEYSVDGGRTWAQLMPVQTHTSSAAVRVGVYGQGPAWSASTGLQIGAFVLAA